MKIDETPCPNCEAVATLFIQTKMVANPIGSFSIAGAGLKVTAQERPVLTCTACEWEKIGRFDSDGGHVIF